MRLAISTGRPDIDGEVDPRFGRCPYLVIVDSESMDFETMANPGATTGGGAGVATAQAIAAKGVAAVLTGNCGPNAYQVLNAANTKVVTGVTGKVREAVRDYESGRLQAVSQPNVEAHAGMRRGMGGGRGMGWR